MADKRQQAAAGEPAIGWDMMSVAMDTATKLVTANLARSDPSSAHNDEMVALMKELVQQVKGLVSTTQAVAASQTAELKAQTAELQSVKSELAATKEEVRSVKAELKASNETQAKDRAQDIKRRNQKARAYNALSKHQYRMILLTDDDGQLPKTNHVGSSAILSSWSDAKVDALLDFYKIKPTVNSQKRHALLQHFQGD